MKIKTIIIIAILLLAGVSVANAGFFDFLKLGGGNSTINALDVWTASTSPFTAISPRTSGKSIYAPYSIATTSKIYATTFCINNASPDCITSWSAGAGEANTGSSLGTGRNLFDSKSGVDLRFNTLSAGTNITLSTTSNNNTIVINSTDAIDGTGFAGMMTSWTDSDTLQSTSTVIGSQVIATSTTATSTFRGFIDVLGTGSNATSTFSGNLWVKGNIQGDGSLFAPLTFTAGDVSLTSLTLTNPLAVAYGGTGATSGYNNTNWDTAYTNRITSAVYPLSIASNIISTAISSSTLTASSPLTGTFAQVGTGGSLGCQTASGSQAGCISSADWTTFNGKQAGDATLTALAGLTISAGSLITGTGADAFSVLAGGTNGYVLAMSSSVPTWVATTTLSTISGTLDISAQSNLTCGTNCTLTGDDISVDDAFILNTGDVGTGSYTFPNASTTQLTSGTNTFYVDSNGRISGKDTTQSLTGVLSPVRHIVLSTATTTAWTASTTGAYIPFLVAPFAGTIQNAVCSTDTSFLGIDLYIASTHLTYFVASTTVGTMTFSSNNTFTAGQLINMAAGTTTTSNSSKVTCTLRITETI